MEHDEITPGTYRDDCDACLRDLHYCHRCRDVVGHGHEHSIDELF